MRYAHTMSRWALVAVIAAALVSPCASARAEEGAGPPTEDDTTITEGSAEQSATTTVVYDLAQSYTINIPKTVDLSGGETQATIRAVSINIKPKHQLDVSLGSDASGVADGKVTLANTLDTSITTTSTVSLSKGGEGLASDAIVATFKAMSTDAVSGGTLYFSALPEGLRAGSYSGSIMFSMAIHEEPV